MTNRLELIMLAQDEDSARSELSRICDVVFGADQWAVEYWGLRSLAAISIGLTRTEYSARVVRV